MPKTFSTRTGGGAPASAHLCAAVALALAACAAAQAPAPPKADPTYPEATVWADASLLGFATAVAHGFLSGAAAEAVTAAAAPAGAAAADLARMLAAGEARPGAPDDERPVAFLTTAPLAAADSPPASATFPVAATAAVLVYNLPCLGDERLVLDADTAALLMSGGISAWNDPRLAGENPTLAAACGAEAVHVPQAADRRLADTLAFVFGGSAPDGGEWAWDAALRRVAAGSGDGVPASEAASVFAALARPHSVVCVTLGAARATGATDTLAAMRNLHGAAVEAAHDTVLAAAADTQVPRWDAASGEPRPEPVRAAGAFGARAWPLAAWVFATVATAAPPAWRGHEDLSGQNVTFCRQASAALQLSRWFMQEPEAVPVAADFGLFPPGSSAGGASEATMDSLTCGGRSLHTGRTTAAGSGASFPQAVYAQWGFQFAVTHPGLGVAYAAGGSTSGKAALLAREVDFAGSDSHLSAAQWAQGRAGGGELSMVPVLAGAVVVAYNLPSVEAAFAPDPAPRLVLDRTTAAAVFGGVIETWRDSAVLALNPALEPHLPRDPITVVHRSDKSGTTEIFTDALSSFSDAFRASHGVSSLPDWRVDDTPRGVGARGNRGVVAAVQATEASIGYVGLDYASANGVRYAAVVNRAGRTVLPSLESIRAAVADAGGDPNGGGGDPNGGAGGALVRSIVDGPGEATWPISGYTYLVYHQLGTPGSCDTQRAALGLFRWALTDRTAEAAASGLGFAPVSGEVREAVLARLDNATCSGTPLVGGCPAGTGYSAFYDSCVECDAGEASPATSRECQACPAGFVSPGGAGAGRCVACPAGSHQSEAGQSECVPNEELSVSGGLAAAGLALAGAGALACAAVGAVTARHRKHKVIKASTPSFMLVVLLGCVLALAAAAVAALDRGTAGVCAAVPALASGAFVLVVCPLLLKTWRLNAIFNGETIRVKRIPTSRLLGVAAAALLVELALHGSRQLADPLERRRVAAVGRDHADVWVCESAGQPVLWWVLFVAPKAALLLWTAVLAYRVRNLSAEFNESQSLAVATALVAFLMVIGLPLLAAADHAPTMHYIVTLGALVCAVAGVVGLVHISKFWAMFVTHEHSGVDSYGVTCTSGPNSKGYSPRSRSPHSPRSPRRSGARRESTTSAGRTASTCATTATTASSGGHRGGRTTRLSSVCAAPHDDASVLNLGHPSSRRSSAPFVAARIPSPAAAAKLDGAAGRGTHVEMPRLEHAGAGAGAAALEPKVKLDKSGLEL